MDCILSEDGDEGIWQILASALRLFLSKKTRPEAISFLQQLFPLTSGSKSEIWKLYSLARRILKIEVVHTLIKVRREFVLSNGSMFL